MWAGKRGLHAQFWAVLVEATVVAFINRDGSSDITVLAHWAWILITVASALWAVVSRRAGNRIQAVIIVDVCWVAVLARWALKAIIEGLGLGEGRVSATRALLLLRVGSAIWAVVVLRALNDASVRRCGRSCAAVALRAQLAVLRIVKVSPVGEGAGWARDLLS